MMLTVTSLTRANRYGRDLLDDTKDAKEWRMAGKYFFVKLEYLPSGLNLRSIAYTLLAHHMKILKWRKFTKSTVDISESPSSSKNNKIGRAWADEVHSLTLSRQPVSTAHFRQFVACVVHDTKFVACCIMIFSVHLKFLG